MTKNFDDLFVKGTPEECWVWIGSISTAGYGYLNKNYAHRFAYERVNGPIPAGHHIDHLCRNTRCCNPNHLEAVTPRENALRGVSPIIVASLEGHCVNGHDHSDDDYITPKGKRQCRECMVLRTAVKVSCPGCGRAIRRSNLPRHVKRMHGSVAARGGYIHAECAKGED